MPRPSKRLKEEDEVKKIPVPATLFGEPVEEMDEEEIDELAEEYQDETDIFLDIGEKLQRAGDKITYTFKRDGVYIAGAIPHPYSWDRLQKEYGGGTYQVIARSTNKGGYVKSQTRNVAHLPQKEEKEEQKTDTRGTTADLLMLLQAQKREEREELLRAEEKRERERQEREERREQERREREEKAEQERREREEAIKESSNNSTMLMLKMMESSAAQTTALLTAMLQGGQRKEPELNVEKIMTLMDSRMEKMIALVQGKDKTKDIDALKLIELQSQAEDRGYKRAMDLQNQAEKKAEELAELRESAVNPQKEESSTTKMLIESVVPAVQTLLSARGGIPVAPQALPQPTQIAAPAASLPGVNPHIPAQAPKRPLLNLGLPKAPQGAAQSKPEVKVVSKKDIIEQTVVNEIAKDLSANLLTQKFDPEKTAQKVLDILAPAEITPEFLCSRYSVEDMMVIAKAKGMPDAIKPYIEKFHAFIKAKAGMGSGGAAEGSKQGAS